MAGLSKEASVVVFADDDDVGVERLVVALGREADVTWWRFGLPEEEVSVDVDDAGFRLEQPGVVVSSEDLWRASVVVHRRLHLHARPMVRSALAAPADRAFSEREWGSLFEGVLLAEEARSDAAWLNPPSAMAATANKLALLLRAARPAAATPASVPSFTVSTPVRLPAAGATQHVTKAISADERIDDERFFSTVMLSTADVEGLPGAALPTPALIQEYVRPEVELRVFWALGQTLCLALQPAADAVDIRHRTRAEMAPRPYALDVATERRLSGLAEGFGLNYCTFDLILAADGRLALIDITPGGDWAYFERDDHAPVTEFLANAVLRSVADRPSRH